MRDYGEFRARAIAAEIGMDVRYLDNSKPDVDALIRAIDTGQYQLRRPQNNAHTDMADAAAYAFNLKAYPQERRAPTPPPRPPRRFKKRKVSQPKPKDTFDPMDGPKRVVEL